MSCFRTKTIYVVYSQSQGGFFKHWLFLTYDNLEALSYRGYLVRTAPSLSHSTELIYHPFKTCGPSTERLEAVLASYRRNLDIPTPIGKINYNEL